MKTLIQFFSLFAFLLLSHSVLADKNPGWQNVSDPARRALATQLLEGNVPTAPLARASSIELQALSTPSVMPPGEANLITSEIQTLARGLRNDPWLIYQYCHDRIRSECYWGSKKGAALTLLEGSGNCFDTSSLMVALLKAAGVQDVEYRYGLRYLYRDEIRSWLGLLDPYSEDGKPFSHLSDVQLRAHYVIPSSTTITDAYRYDLLVSDFLSQRGYPYLMLLDSLDSFVIPHVWVRFKEGNGNLREMDPSLKHPNIYMEQCKRPTATDLGYTRSSFLNALGGTTGLGGNQISGLNATALNTQLSARTNSFLTWLRTNHQRATTEDFIFNNNPFPLSTTATLVSHSLIEGEDYTSSEVVPMASWSQIPEQWQSTVTFTFGNNYDSVTQSFATTYADVPLPTNCLHGQTLSLSFSGTTANFRLGETILASFIVTDASFKLKISINHPYGLLNEDGTFQASESMDQEEIKIYQRNDSFAYAIIYGFDPSAGHLRDSQQRLDNYRKAGLVETDWQVRTESLNLIGLNYLQQIRSSELIAGSIRKTLMASHHFFGRMGQEGAYYIDVGLVSGASYSYSGREPDMLIAADTKNHFASALEHGVIEQLQGASVSAVSTIRIAALANQQNASIYLADTTNWLSVRAALTLTNSWPENALDSIGAELAADSMAKAMIPSRGDIGIASPPATGHWRGYGYSLISSAYTGMFIGGGNAPGQYSGGYLATGSGTLVYQILAAAGTSEPGYYTSASGLSQNAHQPVTTPQWTAADPVDMATGAFLSDATDLQCGEAIPRGFTFHRSYHSNRSMDNSAGLGYGWTHNLDIRATRRSPARAAWGDTTPAQMAASYAAMTIAIDIFANRTTAKDYTVTSLIADWAINRIRDGGVSIQMGGPCIEFVQMPDGAFIPPAGITSVLTSGTGGTLALAERHGNTYQFNAAGYLESITNPDGQRADFAYKSITVNGANKTVLDKVTDAYNRTLTLGWEHGRIIDVTEVAGTLTRGVGYTYINECLETVTDPEDDIFTYGYDANRRLDRMTDARGRIITKNQYDSQGRVCQQYLHGREANKFELFFNGMRNTECNPAGGETSYLYDTRGRGTGIIDATGNRTSLTYDGQDRRLTTVTPKHNGVTTDTYRPTQYSYDANHNLTDVIHPKRSAADTNPSNTVHHDYDAQLRLWKTYDFKGNYSETTYTTKHKIYQKRDRKGTIVQTNSYNTNGTLLSVKDAANNITEYLDYDSYGHPKKIKYPSVTVAGASVQPTELFLYNDRGDLLEYTDRNGNKTTTSYNERRQPRVTILPQVDGITATTETIYDAVGNPAASKDARDNWTYTDISQTGKLLTTTLPHTHAGNPVITRHYDSRDWNDWTQDPLGKKSIVGHDTAGRVTSTINPLGHTTYSSYNADGERVTSTDPLSKITTTRYNWRGEVWQTENALTHTTTLALDANGNQDTYTNKRNKLYDYTYDNNDRLTGLTTPQLKSTTRDWNTRGLLDYIQEPTTDRATQGYDNMGRLLTTIHKRGSTTHATLTRELDKQGNLKKLTEVIPSPASTRILTYSEYDARNRLRTFVDSRSQTLGYRYDAAGNLTQIIYPGTIGSVYYSYDSHNRLETVTDWSNRVTRYHYDLAGRLSRVERPNGTQRRHAYDAIGQLNGVSELNSAKQPIYYAINRHDAAGRQDQEIVSPAPHAFTPPNFTATYDNDNRLTTFNGTATVNDNDGNLTTGPLGAASSAIFTYNTRNQLLSAGGISYTYDPAGNRIGLTNASGETQWTIDSNASLSRALVRQKPGGQKTYYIYGLGLLYEINTVATVTTTTTYHFDSRGSTTALSADNGSTILDRFEYDPYAKETWRQGSYDTPFRYNGAYGVHTDSNGLLHMRARYYNPTIRRFLNADPIGFSGGSNWFAYADGNPISLSDPFGLIAETVWDIANLGMGSYSLGSNLGQGNYGWAALDAVGLVYDGFATAVPFLPAGASAGFNAYRAGNTAINSAQIGLDVARVSDVVHDGAKAIAVASDEIPWQAAMDGSGLHRRVASEVDGSLFALDSTYMAGANRSSGIQPDLIGNGVWADITTAKQWQKHVTTYADDFGSGIPILYQRGTGVVGTTQLRSGAGSLTFGGQAASGSK